MQPNTTASNKAYLNGGYNVLLFINKNGVDKILETLLNIIHFNSSTYTAPKVTIKWKPTSLKLFQQRVNR